MSDTMVLKKLENCKACGSENIEFGLSSVECEDCGWFRGA